jgi:peptidyl-prolyl cis-trans isomerase D
LQEAVALGWYFGASNARAIRARQQGHTMFDFVRSHTRLFQGVLVLLIFPSFVFFGVQGYSRFTDESQAAVAEVDGRSISKPELEQMHQRSVERARQQNPNLDVKLLDTPSLKAETLQAMVRERVLLAAASAQHLSPGNDRLVELFQTDAQYAAFRNADGSVNRDLLAAQGMSSEFFEQQLRQELAQRQVLRGIAGSAMPSAAAAAAALDAFLQRREVQLERFEAKDFLAKVAATDEQVQAYFQANTKLFQAPEEAQIEYVVFDLESVKKGIQVSEKDAQSYYKENAARYTAAEERRASHILLKAEPGQPAAERAKVKTQAEALLTELRRAPTAFADLARKNSQDPGSAVRGGDLDFFGRGAMVKAFEDAAFAMKPGEISGLVESEFGFHIIQLAAVRGGEKQPFEQVRPAIEEEIRLQLAKKRHAEGADQFNNLVYEQSDSLQPAIDKFKLEKRTATIKRNPAPGAAGALGSQRLFDLLFAEESVRKKRNIEAVEVGPNQLVSARILTYNPQRTLPLDAVKVQVKDRLINELAVKAAVKAGEDKLAAAKKQAETALPISLTLARTKPQGQPRAVMDAVLQADSAQLPKLVGVPLEGVGYVVVKVQKVLPREPQPQTDEALNSQYAQAFAAAETDAYLEALKARHKVTLKPNAPTAAAQAASAPK